MTSRNRYDFLETIRVRVTAASTTYPILTTAAADLDRCAPDALAAFQRMQDARAGLPGAQAYDAPSVSGGSATLTQPERMAEQTDRTEPDRRLLDITLNQLDQLTNGHGVITDPGEWCRNITNRALTIRRLIEAWTPHRPTARDLRLVEEANTSAPECVLTRYALNLHAPVHCTSNLRGLVPDPVPVSRWVWRFARDYRRLPTPMEWKANASKDDDLRAQLMAPALRK